MEQTAGIYWDRGGYDINQDSVSFEQVVLRHRIISMAVVADGIGGLSKGELASGYVTGRIVKWFYSEGAYLMLRARSAHLVRRSIERLIYTLHIDLENYGRRNDIVLGTTCTLIIMTGRRYYIAHLGDSRCMIVRRHNACISEMHRNKRNKRNKRRECWVTKDDSGPGHTLSKCIGSMEMFLPSWRAGRIRIADGHMAFLVCSDGFYRKADESRIIDAISSPSIRTRNQIERAIRTIAQQDRKNGEKDNITAVCVII